MDKFNFGWLNQYIFVNPLYMGEDVAKAAIENPDAGKDIKSIDDIKPGDPDKDISYDINSRIDDSTNRLPRDLDDGRLQGQIDSKVNTRNSTVYGNTGIDIGNSNSNW